MNITDISPQLSELDAEIDQLEKALETVVGGGHAALEAKLSPLDRAKLNVLECYTIETLLFTALRLNGKHNQNQSLFAELTRVKQYTEKIKTIEMPPPPRPAAVNVQVANRFVRADLAGNKHVTQKPSEQPATERETNDANSGERLEGNENRPPAYHWTSSRRGMGSYHQYRYQRGRGRNAYGRGRK